MSTVEEILSAGGIQRPADVVAVAGRCNLELAAAATLLLMESDGGSNVWGHDAVSTGGIYTKGGFVTQAAYLLYLSAVLRGEIGRQGVGPCQLTSAELQTTADGVGGCWDWTANCSVGFYHLAALIKGYGERDGFRRYNGSGPAAEHYADTAMELLGSWRTRLATAEDDVALTDEDIQKIAQATAQAVLAATVPDYYADPTGKKPIALGISEAWEATHVGQLLDKVNAIAKKVGA